MGSLPPVPTGSVVLSWSSAPPSMEAASSSRASTGISPFSSESLALLRMPFHARNVRRRATRARSCRSWKMISLLEKTREPRRAASSFALVSWSAV